MIEAQQIEAVITAEAKAVQSGDSITQATDEYRAGYLEALRFSVRALRRAVRHTLEAR